MSKLSMSLITFRVGIKALPKTPKVPFRVAGVHTQFVYASESVPAHYLVTVDNIRLSLLGLKKMTSRSRDEENSKPPLKPWKTYPLVPYRSAPGYVRVLIERAEPVFLSDTTQDVVNGEGYGWIGLTVEGFVRGFREFRKLSHSADPALWRYTYRLIKFPALSGTELASIRAQSMPRSAQARLL